MVIQDRIRRKAAHERVSSPEQDDETRRLQQPCATLQSAQDTSRGYGWWLALGIGVGVVGAAPVMMPALDVVMGPLDTGGGILAGGGVLLVGLYGCKMTVPMVPCTIVAIIFFLHWRPVWYRILVGVAVAILPLATAFVVARRDVELEAMLPILLPLLPTALVAASLPFFVLQWMFRWTIAPRGRCEMAKPVTVISWLLLVTLCGCASGCLRLVEMSELTGNPSTVAIAVAVLANVGVPAATVSCLSAIVLPPVLGRSDPHARRWMIRFVVIAAIAMLGPVVNCLAISSMSPRDTSRIIETTIAMTAFCLGVTSAGLVAAFATALWMKWFGYELLSKRA